jgi:hypothetical protein
MKLFILRLCLVVCLFGTVGMVASCDKEGPAEKTGKSLDKAGQSVKDAIDPPGPAQKVGRAVDKATGSDD